MCSSFVLSEPACPQSGSRKFIRLGPSSRSIQSGDSLSAGPHRINQAVETPGLCYDEGMRLLLKTFSNAFDAEMVAEALRAEGYPVTTVSGSRPTIHTGPAGIGEIWLEDASLWEHTGTRLRIEELLSNPIPLDDDDADEIERMPFVDR